MDLPKLHVVLTLAKLGEELAKATGSNSNSGNASYLCI